jgi:CRP-like cAMP-binding protein
MSRHEYLSKKSSKYQVNAPLTIQDKRANCEKWSSQQLMYWLSTSQLKWLKMVMKEDEAHKKYVRPETAMFERVIAKETVENEIKMVPKNQVALRGGQPTQLVALATLPEDAPLRLIWHESDIFVQELLTVFYAFITPKDLLATLQQRYTFIPTPEPSSEGEEEDDTPPTNIEAAAVIKFLEQYVKHDQAVDFELDSSLIKMYNEFCDTVIAKDRKKDAEDLKKLLKRTLKERASGPKKPEKRKDVEIPSPIVPKPKKGESLAVTDIDPLELARQITLIDERLFLAIRPREFLKQAWNKHDHETRAPNITKFTKNVNRMINWFSTEILKKSAVEERAELIELFIKTAKHLFTLQNFNGVMAVLSSLHSSSISRLQQTWALVSQKQKEVFEQLTNTMSSQRNFKTYRELLATVNPSTPCVPFLAVFLTDCTYLDDCAPDFLKEYGDNFVNWAKWRTFYEKIQEIRRFTTRYALKPVEIIQQFIMESESWEEDKEIYRISLLRENKDNIATVHQSVKGNKSTAHSHRPGLSKLVYLDSAQALQQMNELTDREWQVLLTAATLKTYQPKEVILDIGMTNRHLYRIKSGKVAVEKDLNGVRTEVDEMGPGQMFGEISMLLRAQQGTTTAAIVAKEVVELWVMEVEFVLKLCESEPFLSEKLHRILALKLARRLRNLNVKGKQFKEDQDKGAPQQPHPTKPLTGTLKASVQVAQIQEEVKREDEKFVKTFRLPPTEIILKEFECALKTNRVAHGVLYVSQNYLSFFASVFGLKVKESWPFRAIKKLRKDNKGQIEVTVGDKVYVFKSFEGASHDDVYTFIHNIWEQQQAKAEQIPNLLSSSRRGAASNPSPPSTTTVSELPPPPPPISPNVPIPPPLTTAPAADNVSAAADSSAVLAKKKEIDRFMLSEEDRAKILKGAKCLIYQKDDYVISEGDQFQRIYQLARGSCRIEKLVGNETKVLGRMTSDDGLFGEISFLEGGAASASVIADEPDTAVYIIEGYFLNILFEENPGLSGRFYHYLAHMLSKRLKQREAGIKATVGLPKPKKTLGRDRKRSSHHREKRGSKEGKEHKEGEKKTDITITPLSPSASSHPTDSLSSSASPSTSTLTSIPSAISNSPAIPPTLPTAIEPATPITLTTSPTNSANNDYPIDDKSDDASSSRGEGDSTEVTPTTQLSLSSNPATNHDN